MNRAVPNRRAALFMPGMIGTVLIWVKRLSNILLTSLKIDITKNQSYNLLERITPTGL